TSRSCRIEHPSWAMWWSMRSARSSASGLPHLSPAGMGRIVGGPDEVVAGRRSSVVVSRGIIAITCKTGKRNGVMDRRRLVTGVVASLVALKTSTSLAKEPPALDPVRLSHQANPAMLTATPDPASELYDGDTKDFWLR